MQAIERALDRVDSLDEDRILRGFLTLMLKSVRTNYFQRLPSGAPKPYLSVKLASSEIDLLPLPRPLFEIYVYGPRMEGVHLRAGKVARGGIRWSDRKEDFRTEILGLMKAQTVKNAVIVPVGSKGGFVVKRPPDARSAGARPDRSRGRRLLQDPDARPARPDRQHRRRRKRRASIVPPPNVVRHDGDDPYLVVAADKGTATFSDIANGIAEEYGFWLGDAFASGGSAGYDHKAMGITARGAWELVKRHFRELGTRHPERPTSPGRRRRHVGRRVRQRHAAVAPHPARRRLQPPAHLPRSRSRSGASFAERQRLFDLPRSSWADYDRALISAGGGVFERGAQIDRDQPARCSASWASTADHLTPAELIRHLLTAAGRSPVVRRHRHLRQGARPRAMPRSATAPTTRCASTATRSAPRWSARAPISASPSAAASTMR